MTFIGHDMIDLQLAKKESNIFRNGYLEKILTENEQLLLQNSTDKENFFWKIWSMKESVYKILRQKGAERGYYPKKIEVIKIEVKNGIVSYNRQIFYTQTTLNSHYIETIALENQLDFKKIKRLNQEVKLSKVNEIPFLLIDNKPFAVSKSHHGRFERVVTILR